MFLAAAGYALAAGPGDPVTVIKKKDAELQKLLHEKNPSGQPDAKKTEKIKVLINGIFDFEELGKRALGPDTWKATPPDQQTRFVKAFKGMVEAASVKKLEAYESDSSLYDPPEASEEKASVTTHMWNKGQESIVTYKLLVKDGSWKAWDLIIDDLSTAHNYGEQFHKILQTSDMNALIAKLEKKGGEVSDSKSAGAAKGKSDKSASGSKSTDSKKTSAKAAGKPAKAAVAAPGAASAAAPAAVPAANP